MNYIIRNQTGNQQTSNQQTSNRHNGPPFTQSDWIRGAIDILPGIAFIILSIMYIDGCPAIPSLVYFTFTVGFRFIVWALLHFWCHLDNFKYRLPLDAATIVKIVLQCILLPMLIWGSAITFTNVSQYFASSNDECHTNLFTMSFL